MADQREKEDKEEREEREEKKIPVFTVLKNGCIVKNIFLLDNPPPVPDYVSGEDENGKKSWKSEKEEEEEEEKEEILIVGRHPDCNIMLEHPSISRFHLRIYSKPSSLKLSVIDLSSAHGTWVSDRKIEPGVRIDLNEGDTIRLGASTRVYRLHWFPLNRAFDVENLLISPNLEIPLPIEEKGEEDEEINEIENQVLFEREQKQILIEDPSQTELTENEGEEAYENQYQVPYEKEQNHIPSAPPMPGNTCSSFSDGEEEEEEEEVLYVVPVFEGDEDQSPLRRLDLWSKVHDSVSLNSISLAVEKAQLETINQQIGIENPQALVSMNVLPEIGNQESPPIKSDKKSDTPNIWSRRGKSASKIQIQTGRSRAKNVEVSNTQVMEGEILSRFLFSGPDPDAEEELFTPDKENYTPRPVLGVKSMKKGKLEEIKHQSYSGTLNSKVITTPNFDQVEGRFCSSQKQNSRAPSPFQDQVGEEEILTPDKENFTPRPVLGMKTMNCGSSVLKSITKLNLEEMKHPSFSGSLTSKVITKPNFDQGEGRFCSSPKQNSRASPPFLDQVGEEEIFTPDKENFTPRPVLGMKTMNCESSILKSITKLNFNQEGEEEEVFTSDKENFTQRPVLGTKSVKKCRLEEINNENCSGSSTSKVIMSPNFDQEGEEEVFTPGKENFTPRPVLGVKSVKRGRLEEIKNRNCSGSSTSKVIISPNFDQEEGRLCSPGFDKENLTPIVLQDSKSKKSSSRDPVRFETEKIIMKRQEGRVPFQSLLSPNSISKSKSEFSVRHINTTRSSNSVNCSQTIEKNCFTSRPNQTTEEVNRRWNMVVDTNCLLNKDSWKSLKLLQGLKETHLIIPRMVIRELDNLKRRGSLFRRVTEVSAASVLEWIEECMVKTSWWIHVQKSLEESMPIAPTPPASPQSLLNEGSSSPFARSLPFSPFGSLMELVSPTAQDHILECALLFKRMRNNERLVLLSGDVSLKIKAMAEGIMCETAEDFRESLVNPYSPRFMWSESTPRGHTWSCLDEAAVLREKKCYQFFPVKKTKAAEGGAKGLKLILLHNSSHYGQRMNSVN